MVGEQAQEIAVLETILSGATFAVAAGVFWRMGKMQGQLNGHLENHDRLMVEHEKRAEERAESLEALTSEIRGAQDKVMQQHEDSAVERARKMREESDEKRWGWHQEQHQRAETKAEHKEERREDREEEGR